MTTELSPSPFPNLPTELRLSIFSHVLDNLRYTLYITQTSGFWATSPSLPIIESPLPSIPTSHTRSRFIYTDGTEQYTARFSPSDIPALLHVNREARELALKRYISATLDDTEGVWRYFDFQRDMLVLRCHPAWGSPSTEEEPPVHERILRDRLARVRNLMILGFRHRNYAFATLSLAPFLSLETVVLVRRCDGRKGNRIERVRRRAVNAFWKEKTNRRQREAGVEASDKPRIVFVSFDEVLAIEEKCEGGR